MNNNKGVLQRFEQKHVASPKMFWGTRKGDKKMKKIMNDSFSTDAPENAELMRSLLRQWNVPDDSLVLGVDCKREKINEQGVTFCLD
jgi:hypothetical protein